MLDDNDVTGVSHLFSLKKPWSVLLSLMVTVNRFMVTSVTVTRSRLDRLGLHEDAARAGKSHVDCDCGARQDIFTWCFIFSGWETHVLRRLSGLLCPLGSLVRMSGLKAQV